MRRLPRAFVVVLSCVVGANSVCRAQAAARPGPAVEWPASAHDAAGTKHSPASQITRANVNKLVPVWTYRTGDFSLGDGMARDETTPLYVDHTVYASTPFGGVRAIDGDSGAELWSFDSEVDLSGDYGDFTNRGVSTWVDPSRRAGAACRRRIFIATVDARLIALDSGTGQPCADFGSHGQVLLGRDLVNAPAYKGEYAVTSPPAIVNGTVIVGSTVGDGRRAASPSGVGARVRRANGCAQVVVGSGRARFDTGRVRHVARTHGAPHRRGERLVDH
jgi:Glucose dehydrogenase